MYHTRTSLYDRSLEKTPEQVFINSLRKEFELSPAESAGVLELAKSCLFGEVPQTLGKLKFLCASQKAKHGKTLQEQNLIRVTLTLDNGVENLDVLRLQGSVAFMDEDNDGDYDMFFGGWGHEIEQENIYFFRNTGDKTSPEFEFVTKDYAGIHVGGWQVPVFYDIDNDRDLDLLIGEKNGGINLFINDGLNGINKHGSQFHLPDSPKLYQNYPNPFNNNTVINLYMNEPSEIELYICDINGKRVKNVLNGPLTTGNHRIEWDGVSETGKNAASGAYFCVLKGGGFFKKIQITFNQIRKQ